MELPFYLNFVEFKKTYYDNLEKWFEVYYNTNEIDYLKMLAALYSPYVYYNFAQDRLQTDTSITVKNYFFSYYEKFGLSFYPDVGKKNFQENQNAMNHVLEWKMISMMEYAQHILDMVNKYLSKKHHGKYKNVHDCINDYNVVCSKDNVGYYINYHHHQSTIPFLKAYLPCSGQTVEVGKYKDFISSVGLIANFIDEKLRSVNADEKTVFAKLKSKARFEVEMNHQFLTICN